MQLLITPLAAYDLEEIGDYIAQDNPVRAGSGHERKKKRFAAVGRS